MESTDQNLDQVSEEEVGAGEKTDILPDPSTSQVVINVSEHTTEALSEDDGWEGGGLG